MKFNFSHTRDFWHQAVERDPIEFNTLEEILSFIKNMALETGGTRDDCHEVIIGYDRFEDQFYFEVYDDYRE